MRGKSKSDYRNTMLRSLICLIFIALLANSGLSSAQTPDPNRLEEIEREKAEAEARQQQLEEQRRAAEREVSGLQEQLVRVAAEAQAYERAAAEAEARIAELRKEEDALLQEIYSDRQALIDLLAALQRIERNPPPALMTQPESAKQAAQAAILMGELTPRINKRTEKLRVRLNNLQSVRRNIEAEQLLLTEARSDLDARRTHISVLVADKRAAEAKFGQQRDAAQAEARRLANEADDIRDLIARFEAEAREAQPRIKPDPYQPSRNPSSAIPVPQLKPRPDRPPQPLRLLPDTQRFADARGQLNPPAQGRILTRFGDREAGERTKGVTLSTGSSAQVLAPYYGRVEFAGAFKNYEQVVIINAGEGYFLLLTGLGEVYVEKGANLRVGEPVGRMPARNNRRLYIEFRKDSRPINPAPWLGPEFARPG